MRVIILIIFSIMLAGTGKAQSCDFDPDTMTKFVLKRAAKRFNHPSTFKAVWLNPIEFAGEDDGFYYYLIYLFGL